MNRPLIKEYFAKGAKWTTAPKPLMSEELYNLELELDDNGVPQRGEFVTTGRKKWI